MPIRILALLAAASAVFAQTPPSEKRVHRWWTDRPPGMRAYSTDARKMPLISVKGNRFVDPQGNTVLFRGLAIADPTSSIWTATGTVSYSSR